MKLSSHITISPSATLAMNTLAAEKKKKGEVVYNLTVGEPMIETSKIVSDAAKKALDEGKTLYTPVAGISELRDEVSLWMNKNFASNFKKENILVSCGGKHALLMTLQSLLEVGDEVLIPAPYWVSYPSMVELCGGKSIVIETEEKNNWKVTADQIENACSAKTKILILNNGGNPTGVLYTKEEIENILKIAKEKNLIVISDEVYSGLVYDSQKFVSVASFLEYRECSVIIQSCSKHFAMTGWRVGFVFGPVKLIALIETLQSQSTTGTSSISQWAALAAFQHADEIIPQINAQMQLRRDAFVENFKKYFGVDLLSPQAGLYAFISLKDFGVIETDSVAWCMKILEKANVVFVPGAPFGVEGYVRASFGGKIEDVGAGLQNLAQYLKGCA
jgi:aspartate/methionine/tyrosine aminotransferase